jgi:hypothetical protein
MSARAERTADLTGVVDGLDWPAAVEQLDELGCASIGAVLSPDACRSLVALYADDTLFRSTVDMARHRFGHGEYRYFGRPLPELVRTLRAAFWLHLLPVARTWAERLDRAAPWPDSFDEWLDRCHEAGQSRPTPLLLRYGPGDWNALHRDLYGDLVFPLQVVIGLDRPGVDFTGGELLVVEQRPRSQSRGTALVLEQGHAVIVTTSERPLRSTRGWSRAPVRHGVSVVRSGHRHTLGLLFHDAT